MVEKERRMILCEKYNRESEGLRKVVSAYINLFKLENNVTDIEWEELKKSPESGELK